MEVWVFPTPDDLTDEHLRALRSREVRGLVLGAEETDLAEKAKGLGIKTHALVVDFDPGDKEKSERNKVVDIDGHKQDWFFGSGCPNAPELREADLERASQIANLEVFDGMMLDGIRFPSPSAGLNPFLSCFCEHCFRKAAENGLDLGKVRSWLLEARGKLFDMVPEVANFSTERGIMDGVQFCVENEPFVRWLSFRSACISEHISDLHKILKGKKEIVGAVFPPPLSALVGQDYGLLAAELDAIFPMTYTCYEGVACTNEELSVIPLELVGARQVDQKALCRLIFSVFGFPAELAPDSLHKMKRYVPGEVIASEVSRALSLAKGQVPIIPFLMLGDPQLANTVRRCAEKRPQGLSFLPLEIGEKPEGKFMAVDEILNAVDTVQQIIPG